MEPLWVIAAVLGAIFLVSVYLGAQLFILQARTVYHQREVQDKLIEMAVHQTDQILALKSPEAASVVSARNEDQVRDIIWRALHEAEDQGRPVGGF